MKFIKKLYHIYELHFGNISHRIQTKPSNKHHVRYLVNNRYQCLGVYFFISIFFSRRPLRGWSPGMEEKRQTSGHNVVKGLRKSKSLESL